MSPLNTGSINKYQIFEIPNQSAQDVEVLGTKEKFWFDFEGHQFLFKADDRGTGEDWAEKIVCEVASLLGLPHVDYNLARHWKDSSNPSPGVLCANLCADGESLVMGNQLLANRDGEYPLSPANNFDANAHHIQVVWDVLTDPLMLAPDERWLKQMPMEIQSAPSIFVGYVLLDALVGNQDRHHQNWGAVVSAVRLRLAPTFDHGAALARNISDAERRERMQTKDQGRTVEHFASRAKSAFYADLKSPTTLSTFEAARQFGNLRPSAARFWQGRIEGLHMDELRAIVDKVPSERMTETTKEFTLRLMKCNKKTVQQMVFDE